MSPTGTEGTSVVSIEAHPPCWIGATPQPECEGKTEGSQLILEQQNSFKRETGRLIEEPMTSLTGETEVLEAPRLFDRAKQVLEGLVALGLGRSAAELGWGQEVLQNRALVLFET